ncbi:hypothetical protein GCM10029992_19750 [Glycomyces albus]
MGQGPGGGPRRQRHGLAGADEARGGGRDGLFLGLLADLLDGEPGFGGGAEVDGGGAAVDLGHQAAFGEGLQVAADRHVGHAELVDQFGDADGAGPVDALGDSALSLLCQHRRWLLWFRKHNAQDPTQVNITGSISAIPGGRCLRPDVRIEP